MAQYTDGQLIFTQGNQRVVGVGTDFIAAGIAVGMPVSRHGSGIPYFVGAVVDGTNIDLTGNYLGQSETADYLIALDTTAGGVVKPGPNDRDASLITGIAMDMLEAGLAPADHNHDGTYALTSAPYNAIGDGVADDTVAVIAAVAAGVRLTGSGKTYAVSGSISLPTGTDLEDATFKQLAPSGSATRTLLSSGADEIRLKNVTVDRNGDGAGGSLNDAAGIWIAGGSNHVFEDLTVHGADMGSGIAIHNTTNSRLIRPRVYGTKYALASATDDNVQGVWLNGNLNLLVVHPDVRDLGGTLGGVATTRYSRGISLSGNIQCTVLVPNIADVDQGIDFTGSIGNLRCSVIGGYITDAYTWGVKLANSAVDSKITGVTALRCGYAGFVASGPAEAALTYKTQGCVFSNCLALDTGSNGHWVANSPTGFLIFPGAFDTDYPKGILLDNCEARDEQGVATMMYGFKNDVAFTGLPANETRNCRVSGAISTTPIIGFHYHAARVTKSAAQSIPNNVTTSVDWDVQTYDGAEMHNVASNNNIITIKQAGWYSISGQVFWLGNAAGSRAVSVVVSGVPVAYGSVPSTANDFTLPVAHHAYLEEGATVRLEAWQNSGSDLNVRHEFSWLEAHLSSGAGGAA